MMRIKKYFVQDMSEALPLIRDELGPNAVILHSRPVPKGLRQLRSGRMEVVAAVDDELPPLTPQPAMDTMQITTSSNMSQIEEDIAEIRAALLKKRALNLTISDRIEGEIAEIRAALSELRSGFQPHVQLSLAPTLTGLHSRLLSQGVTEKLAAETISAVAAELSTRALADEEAVHACAARHLRRQLPETTPLQLNPGHPTVLFIIGPTGVGKTTTLAKLAGRYALAQRRRVALINTDTDRVVSASQLRTYGDALGLSTAIASTPAELQAQVETFHDRDLILVDMPGCSQYDQVALERHRAFLTNVPHRKVFLAVSCNTRYEEMLQIANRFALVSLDGLLFTKADETRLFGAVYDLACDLQLSLTYLTNGQRVPEDIEVATATRITQLLLEGS